MQNNEVEAESKLLFQKFTFFLVKEKKKDSVTA